MRVGDFTVLRSYKRRKEVAQGDPQLVTISAGKMERYTRNERAKNTNKDTLAKNEMGNHRANSSNTRITHE